ncbi:MAG: hypothetical protein M9894_06085 [Planctomycetes bacterium]|nr:hypothetical protein [Planctomycetota bacterium]
MQDLTRTRRDPGPRSLPCERCGGVTTHAQGACTGCALRRENRRVGALWLVLALPLLLLAGSWLRSAPDLPWSWRHRSNAGVAIIAGLGGLYLARRGLRGLALGRSPEDA